MKNISKVIACLKALGFKPVINQFEDKLIIQKVVYLLQLKGVKIDFKYNLHIRGPYSPDLTKEIYQRKEEFENLRTVVSLNSKETAIVQELKNLFELKPSLLEIASTYAYFISHKEDPISALKKVKGLKPFISEAQTAVGISRVKEFLFRPTPKDEADMKAEYAAWQNAYVETLEN